MNNDTNTNDSLLNNSFFSSYPPSFNPSLFNQNSNNCRRCDCGRQDMTHMSNQLNLINKNIELLNDQIKLLDMKISISMQNKEKSYPNNNNRNRQSYNFNSPSPSNSVQNKKYGQPKSRPYKNYDVDSPNTRVQPPIPTLVPSMVIHVDDIGDTTTINNLEQSNPMNIIKKMFPFIDPVGKKLLNLMK